MSLSCSKCGADVHKRYVAGVPIYRHATPNFDHAPMPVTAPAPRPGSGKASPTPRTRLIRPTALAPSIPVGTSKP